MKKEEDSPSWLLYQKSTLDSKFVFVMGVHKVMEEVYLLSNGGWEVEEKSN